MLEFLVALQRGIHSTLSGNIAAFAAPDDWLLAANILATSEGAATVLPQALNELQQAHTATT